MTPMVGSVFAFGFNFSPIGWAPCDGQLLSISQYQALFALIGTTYGGDGVSTFGLPNLMGRTPIGFGQGLGLQNYVLGQIGGAENLTLTVGNMPAHTHVGAAVVPVTTNAATTNIPATGDVLATSSFANAYNTASGGGPMAAGTTSPSGPAGSNIPFSILNPYQTVNYCIALEGIFPTRN